MGDMLTGALGLGAGLLGKKDKAPAAPDYTAAALATSNAGRFNEVNPFGAVGWSLRPGADPANPQAGDYIRTTALAPGQQGLFDQQLQNQGAAGQAAAGQLGQLDGGAQAVADALYGKQTQYLDRTFGDQTNALTTRLQNQGLTEGSEAYDRELRNLRTTHNDAYTTAANNATIGGSVEQNSIVNRLSQLLNMSQPSIPTANNIGAGPDLLGAQQASYGANMDQYNAKQASKAQTTSDMMGLASLGLMAFSDRRLKSDIKFVGKGSHGLSIYDYEIFGKRERGYMADEVAERFPNSVEEHSSGYMLVDYASLGGRP